MTEDSESTKKVEFQVSTANKAGNNYKMFVVSPMGIENRQTGGRKVEFRVSTASTIIITCTFSVSC